MSRDAYVYAPPLKTLRLMSTQFQMVPLDKIQEMRENTYTMVLLI